MRMRRKKHLEERLENASDYLLIADKKAVNVQQALKDKKIINLNCVFGNDNPIFLDIGAGKGKFVIESALKNPDNNYIGVEMLENIIVSACEKAQNLGLKNVKFINSGAEYLQRYFDENSVTQISLNFSPPYPKKSFANRRLTNDRYLNIYKSLLKKDGVVVQKTDDKDFFEYSLNSFSESGFEVFKLSDEEILKTATTEYEEKFRGMNMKIYGLKAVLSEKE